ncbi:MAG: Rab family GTPase [Candidatus Hodarchaeales archaeon]
MEELVHKVFLAGEGNTGKTEIFKRFTGYSFNPGSTRAFNVAQKAINELGINIQLTDLSGKKVYYDLRESFFNDSIAGMLVFDLSNKVTLFLIQDWLRQIQSFFADHPEKMPIIFIVGNKADLREEGTIKCLSDKEARLFVEKMKRKFSYDMKYYEVSAKNNTGINDLIMEIAKGIKQIRANGINKLKEEPIDASDISD